MQTSSQTALLKAIKDIVDHDGENIQTFRLHAAVVAIQDFEQNQPPAVTESAQSATESAAKRLIGQYVSGPLNLAGFDLSGLTLPTIVSGWMDASGCIFDGTTLPTIVEKSLSISHCDLRGVTLPRTVGTVLDLRHCELMGATLPTSVGGWLDLRGSDLQGVTLPETIGGDLFLSNSAIKDFAQFLRQKGGAA